MDYGKKVLGSNNITIKEHAKVESITKAGEHFKVVIQSGEEYIAKSVLLAIGRRGTPRKLSVPGEQLEKVAYRLLEPELIEGKNVMVAGGGDSAIEAALSLADQNKVVLTYRGEAFQRIKAKNSEKINQAIEAKKIEVIFNSNIESIHEDEIILILPENRKTTIPNDLVYIFAGGELPTQFLQKTGILITTRFGHTLLKHQKRR